MQREAWSSVERWSGGCPKPPMFPSFPLGVPAPISQGLEMEFHILPVHVLIGTPSLTAGTVKPSIAPPTAPVLSLGGQRVRFLQSPANNFDSRLCPAGWQEDNFVLF